MLDDSGWRYRYAPTFDVATMAKASWAPPEPISVTDSESMGRYVRESLRCQAKLGSGAYQVPGFMPDHKQEDLRPAYATLASILATFDELPPKPLVLFVEGHSSSLAMTRSEPVEDADGNDQEPRLTIVDADEDVASLRAQPHRNEQPPTAVNRDDRTSVLRGGRSPISSS